MKLKSIKCDCGNKLKPVRVASGDMLRVTYGCSMCKQSVRFNGKNMSQIGKWVNDLIAKQRDDKIKERIRVRKEQEEKECSK